MPPSNAHIAQTYSANAQANTITTAISPLVYVKLTLVAMIWGGTFIAGRIVAKVLPPLTAATARFAIAVVLLLAIVRFAEGGLPRLNRAQIAMTAALGFFGIFLYNLCFLWHLPICQRAALHCSSPSIQSSPRYSPHCCCVSA